MPLFHDDLDRLKQHKLKQDQEKRDPWFRIVVFSVDGQPRMTLPDKKTFFINDRIDHQTRWFVLRVSHLDDDVQVGSRVDMTDLEYPYLGGTGNIKNIMTISDGDGDIAYQLDLQFDVGEMVTDRSTANPFLRSDRQDQAGYFFLDEDDLKRIDDAGSSETEEQDHDNI